MEYEEQYSEAELLSYLRELASEIERSPTFNDMDAAEDYPSAKTYEIRFGTWNTAKERAGLETFASRKTGNPVYTDQELLEALQEFDEIIDGPVTQKRLEAHDEYPSSITYQDRFGSWNDAKSQAGVTPDGHQSRENTDSK